MADRMRVAVVGYGQIARSHTRSFRQDGHHLAWLIGRVPDKTAGFAQEHGYARHSTKLEDALADGEVDAVVLCTPSEQHAAQTEQCLAAGKHVLVEIPLAMSFAEGQRLADQARASGLTLMVAHTHRYAPAMQRAQQMIRAGQITLHNVVARYMFLRRENVGASGYVRSWTDNLLWHHGQHATDMALWLLGVERPGEVDVTSMVALPDRALGIPLDLSIVLRTKGDQLATIAMSYNAHVSLYDYVLIGQEDTLVIADNVLRHRDGVLYDPKGDESEARNSGLMQNREFVAAIRERRPSAISAQAVLPALDVLQRVQDAFDRWAPPGATHPTPDSGRGAP